MSRSGKILTIFSGFVLVVVVMVFAAAWYYAGAVRAQALEVEREQDRFDLKVLSIEGGRITLEAATETASKGRWGKPGIWGLESAGTYNQVGRIVEAGDNSVVRELIALGPLPQGESRSASTGMPFRATRGSRTGLSSRKSASRQPWERIPPG